jgi:hypothetical protein
VKPAIALLLFVACGSPFPPPDCVSEAGARLFGLGNYRGTCEDFQAAEDRALAAFPSELRPRLRGLTIGVQAAPVWQSYGQGVGGATFCDLRSMQVGPGPWRQNGYAHEIAHVLQCPEQDNTHEAWGLEWHWIDEANR